MRKGGPQKPRAEIKWRVMAAKCGSGNPAVDFPPTLLAAVAGVRTPRY